MSRRRRNRNRALTAINTVLSISPQLQTQRDREEKRREQIAAVRQAFDADALRRICTMSSEEFMEYGEPFDVAQKAPDDFYFYTDNDSDILGIAHLDSVSSKLTFDIANSAAGKVVFSPTLDDRLGAYVILDLLPKLGIKVDWLLTTGEESCRSTAAFFTPTKNYRWMFQFDRGGTDVVMYEYETADLISRVKDSGAAVGQGSFSDICMLEHLGCAGVNWGVGYRDYHGPRSHAYLEDTFAMVASFVRFYEANQDQHLAHEEDHWATEAATTLSPANAAPWWSGINDDLCPDCSSPLDGEFCKGCNVIWKEKQEMDDESAAWEELRARYGDHKYLA